MGMTRQAGPKRSQAEQAQRIVDKGARRTDRRRQNTLRAALGRTGSGAWPTSGNVTEGDAALAEVVRRQFQRDLVTCQDTDMVFAHLAGGIGHQLVTVVQRDAKTRIRQDLVYQAVHFNQFFLSHDSTP